MRAGPWAPAAGGVTDSALVDDLEPALQLLTPLGRQVVESAARVARDALLAFAATQRWTTVPHDAFAEWATRSVTTRRALVLDPFLPLPSENAVRAGIRRRLAARVWTISGELPAGTAWAAASDVIVVDDVANTGNTLGHAAKLIEAAGGRPTAFFVAAATSHARETVLRRFPRAAWHEFLAAPAAAIHLRDGMPFVPRAGRVLEERAPIASEHGMIPIRVPSTAIAGGLWERAIRHGPVQAALVGALAAIIDRFSSCLGRPAVVGDLPRLGIDVALPLMPGQSATPATSLQSLWFD